MIRLLVVVAAAAAPAAPAGYESIVVLLVLKVEGVTVATTARRLRYNTVHSSVEEMMMVGWFMCVCVCVRGNGKMQWWLCVCLFGYICKKKCSVLLLLAS